jgi:glutathione synthase
MKIAFLADPLDSFKIYKDTTYAMMAEAARRGHQLYAFEQGDLAWEGGMVVADTAQITLTGDPHNWYRATASRTTALAEFDAIQLRKEPPFDMEYVYTTYLLERAEAQGARVVNRPRAVRDHNEKLAITEFARFVAPTIVTRDERRLRAFHAEHRDLIFKPLDGMGGTGIFRVRDDELNLGAIIETLTDNGRRTIMAQRFIPQVADGDKHILLIGGRVVPYCLARIPQGTEVRGNLAAGGVGVAQPISERDREIGEALAPLLADRGLLLVGLDAIGDYLTELNVTSPTCFQEITQQTGFDVAAMFNDALEAQAA